MQQSALRGTVSSTTGGKFANGASTASFAHMFGQAIHGHRGNVILDAFNRIGRVVEQLDIKWIKENMAKSFSVIDRTSSSAVVFVFKFYITQSNG